MRGRITGGDNEQGRVATGREKGRKGELDRVLLTRGEGKEDLM